MISKEGYWISVALASYNLSMPNAERKIKPDQKRQLIAEAGGKCANPGCSNFRVHIHHIKHWSVYKTHDAKHMIAVCPACHDAIHYGQIPVNDETLYAWKGIERAKASPVANIFVEPAVDLRIFTGGFDLQSSEPALTVLHLSANSSFSFCALDSDLMRMNARLCNAVGEEIVRVVDNVVRGHTDPRLELAFIPGRASVTVPTTRDFIPGWLVDCIRKVDPKLIVKDRMCLLDIHVLRPGYVQLMGIWLDGDLAVVISPDSIYFCHKEQRGLPLALGTYGGGNPPTIRVNGPIGVALFDSIAKLVVQRL